MAKKKKGSAPKAGAAGGVVPLPAAGPAGAAPPSTSSAVAAEGRRPLPLEAAHGDKTLVFLSLIMLLAPGLGVPAEEMLQDTLKSIVVAFGALGAAALFFWQKRQRQEALRWHAIVWLPLALTAYALGSMAWSHAFLAGVEAIRWFIFALLLWLGLQSLSRERAPWLALGIHGGAVLASLWTALQFWLDLRLFPQGPNPASTFVNRNFFAEFVVCTLPFSIWLLARARSSSGIALLAASIGFNIAAVLMTGTRSALLAMLALAVVLPLALWRARKHLAFMQWEMPLRVLALAFLTVTVAGLGLIPTGNDTLVQDHLLGQRGLTPIERSFSRALSMTQSKEYSEGSFSARWVMWSATARMIRDRPLSGVGAGAWEVDVPLYQQEGAQLETDYYAHNEPLQLLAEYGLVGWFFLLGLLAYLAHAAWRTWRLRTDEELAEVPVRAMALCALLALLIVSNAGFPWRMASTGALFALALALLAASDARLGHRGVAQASALPWKPLFSRVALAGSLGALALAVYIADRAAECERDIVRAVRISLAIASSPNPNDPRWGQAKAEMLESIRRGIAINPHYRKLTPMVADHLAGWGDWKNAIAIWDSVAQSRPYVIAILSNIARGYIDAKDYDQARAYVERARKVQPQAAAVRSLEILLLQHSGKKAEALALLKESFQRGVFDYDMTMAAYLFGSEAGDWDLALDGLQRAAKGWPQQAADAWLKMARIYASPQRHDEAKALEAYRSALDAVPEAERPAVLQRIPPAYLGKL